MSEYLLTPFGPVREQACDYNGHFNEAQSLVLLTEATDTLLDRVGLDGAGRERLQYSAFTVQNQLYYRAEAHLGDMLFARTLLLGFDSKRLRLYHQLVRGADQVVIVEMESLLLGVETEQRAVSPWPAEVLAGLRQLSQRQSGLPTPDTAGQGISRPALREQV